jgi:hypothetical protein
LIKSAVTNLLLQSEAIDNTTNWNRIGGGTGSTPVVNANAAIAPDGTTTADEVVLALNGGTTVNDSSYITQSYQSISGLVYTVSIWLRTISGDVVIALDVDSNTANLVTVTPVWQRFSFNRVTSTTGSRTVRFGIRGTFTTATDSATFYAWGAQLEQASTVGDYIPTVAAINSAPRFDHRVTSSATNFIRNNTMVGAVAGTPGTLPTNWTTGGNAALSTQIVGTGIDDGITYIDVRCFGTTAVTASPETYFIFDTVGAIPVALNQWTASCYAKIVGGTQTGILNGELYILGYNSSAALNVADATSFNYSSLVDRFSNCRISKTHTFVLSTTVSSVQRIDVNFTAGGGTAVDFTLRIGMPQMELGSVATAPIPTTTAAATNTNTESLGLLVEEARTNSITNNTMVGAVAGTPGTNPTGWPFVSAAGGLTRQIIGVGTESGISYIDYRFSGTTTDANGVNIAPGNGAALTGQTWSASTYWKLAGGSNTGISSFAIGLIEETSGGGFVTGAFYGQTAPTSGPLISQRPTATRTLTGGATVAFVRHTIQISIPTATVIDFTIRIGLPQLEQGAFATSPILTSTATVTRAADVASITGSNFSSFYNQTEGTVFANYAERAFSATHQVATISNGTTNERISVAVNSSNVLDVGVISGGTDTFGGNTPTLTAQEYKIGFGYKADNSGVSANGSAITVDSAVTLPTVVSQFDIGVRGSSQSLNSTIKRLTYWPTRLADNTLQAITQ